MEMGIPLKIALVNMTVPDLRVTGEVRPHQDMVVALHQAHLQRLEGMAEGRHPAPHQLLEPTAEDHRLALRQRQA